MVICEGGIPDQVGRTGKPYDRLYVNEWVGRRANAYFKERGGACLIQGREGADLNEVDIDVVRGDVFTVTVLFSCPGRRFYSGS